MNRTNFERVTASAATLGEFLGGLSIIEGPWDEEFHKRFCAACPATECDACPHETQRNSPEWWLSLQEEASR